MRRDLGLLRPGDEVAVDLRILTGRRLDLVNDRTREVPKDPSTNSGPHDELMRLNGGGGNGASPTG
ncbi:hypothetical protein [Streptomyces mirabilis]|uniref:hypothetical protein n=1 Tax=Streptomyces mirabilis TaxID=68239 RepID=UPI0035D9E1C2